MNPPSSGGQHHVPRQQATPQGVEDIDNPTGAQPQWSSPRGRHWLLAALVGLAATLRVLDLGGPSLWYDEVVSMRLARTPTVSGLFERLEATDATRAPLHPLILQNWLRVFGTSEFAGRSLSAVCGIGSVVLVLLTGRRMLNENAAWLAALLTAISPVLVQYSRELRMYGLLVLLACFAWNIVAARGVWSRTQILAYTISLVALGYTHPLGLLMFPALALATWIDRARKGLSLRNWLCVHAAASGLVIPWLPRYLDHAPEFVQPGGRALRFLLGMPIGFTGGNSLVLGACLAVIALGIWRGWRNGEERRAILLLLCWLLIPTLLLYTLSWIGPPLFGPARYTLFIAPAYLLLLAKGLVCLSRFAAGGMLVFLCSVALFQVQSTVFAPGLKADWRGAAQTIAQREGRDSLLTVELALADARYPYEREAARYYLGPGVHLVISGTPEASELDGPRWQAVATRGGLPVVALPELPDGPARVVEIYRLPGLLLRRLPP